MNKRLSAVQRAATVFGGLAALGRACVTPEHPHGVARSTVAHWDRPREKHNGRGGSIPDRYHPVILATARSAGLPLKAEDLIND